MIQGEFVSQKTKITAPPVYELCRTLCYKALVVKLIKVSNTIYSIIIFT